jgi:hypothetical protein
LALFLQACKVLDLCLAMPENRLPQFQMYSWGFVREGYIHLDDNGDNSQASLPEEDFVPHVVRVSNLLLKRVRFHFKFFIRIHPVT